MEQQIATVLGAVIVAGILWLAKSASETGKAITRMETILTGVNGDNGIAGEVRQLRERSHKHGNEIHRVLGRVDLHEQRLEALEERGA